MRRRFDNALSLAFKTAGFNCILAAILALSVIMPTILMPRITFAETENKVARFFGTYAGKSASVSGEKVSDRELMVTIKPHEDSGFTVDWTTVIKRRDGEVNVKEHSINFYAVKREGMYASAMRRDVFGHLVPFNPIEGDPYVWAGLEGDTLTVNALYLTDGGGYEMQVYRRTLVENGMHLEFERLRDGKQVTSVVASLQRVE